MLGTEEDLLGFETHLGVMKFIFLSSVCWGAQRPITHDSVTRCLVLPHLAFSSRFARLISKPQNRALFWAQELLAKWLLHLTAYPALLWRSLKLFSLGQWTLDIQHLPAPIMVEWKWSWLRKEGGVNVWHQRAGQPFLRLRDRLRPGVPVHRGHAQLLPDPDRGEYKSLKRCCCSFSWHRGWSIFSIPFGIICLQKASVNFVCSPILSYEQYCLKELEMDPSNLTPEVMHHMQAYNNILFCVPGRRWKFMFWQGQRPFWARIYLTPHALEIGGEHICAHLLWRNKREKIIISRKWKKL